MLAKLLHSQLARASDRAADGALGLERAQQAKRSRAAFWMLLHPVTGIVLAYLRQPRHARPTETSKSNATLTRFEKAESRQVALDFEASGWMCGGFFCRHVQQCAVRWKRMYALLYSFS